jgi:hypothetical protein
LGQRSRYGVGIRLRLADPAGSLAGDFGIGP